MAQEHQEYIQTKVNPTLENLVTQVLLERPENPVPFMIQWLAQQTKAAPPQVADSGEKKKLENEIFELGHEIAALETKLGPSSAAAAGADPASKSARTDEEESEEDEDDDVDMDDMPPPPASYTQGKQRASVSAEAYGDWNKVQAFVPIVHEKTEDQKARLTSVLKISFLFSALDKANMDIIVNAMVEKVFPAGERIIKEGDDGDCMYVIEKGTLDCMKSISGVEKVVKTCGAGDFFGELALLYNCPRAASVEAKDDSVLWQLDGKTFNAIVKGASMKKREMLEQFLKEVPILETLSSTDKSGLIDSLHKEMVSAGATVIKQGDTANRFYLVETGELTASKSGSDGVSKDVLNYKRGDYFGELGLIKAEGRAATVVANTDCELLWLDIKTFKSMLGSLEDLMTKKSSEYVQ